MTTIIHFPHTTTAPHRPDDILNAAMGKGFDAVLVIGRLPGNDLWISASTSDAERLVFLLELVKCKILDSVPSR